MDERFSQIDVRFDAVDKRFDELEYFVNGHRTRLERLEDRVQILETKVETKRRKA